MGAKLNLLTPTIQFEAFASKYPEIRNAHVLVNGTTTQLSSILRTLLLDISNPPTRIVGADAARWFNLPIPTNNLEFIQNICKSIWNNPTEYTDQQFECVEDGFYEFLKFLWVEVGDKQCRLGDMALGSLDAIQWSRR